MDEQRRLDYEPKLARTGHSVFGVASVCMAVAVFVFVFVCGTEFLDKSPFQSMGNDKETGVSCIASILGMLLSARALSEPIHKRTLGTVGLCLNLLALLASMILLPYI